MLLTDRIEDTYTVEDFIELGKDMDDIQYSKFAILSRASANVSNPILYAEHNVIYDYEEEFKKVSLDVEMTNEELNKYIYKPKLLSYDLYGSTELYFVILFINGIYDIKDFNKRNIKLLKKDTMKEILEAIYNAEQDYINANRSSIEYLN